MQSLDRLDIDTPEQIALEFPLAGIGSRFLALAVDSLLQIAVVAALFIVGAIAAIGYSDAMNGAGRFFSQTLGAILLVLVPFCLYWGYFAFFEILWQGKTPGKRLAGIRVIHQTGRPMTAVECIGRNLMRGVDILPGIYAAGLVCMMCNKQNRRIGDYLAGTIVVHDKGTEAVASAVSWGSDTDRAQPTEVRNLASNELVLIETYLNRRYQLDYTIRTATAQRIVTMISEKTGAQKPPDQSDDDFLEAVARRLRDTAGFR